MKNQRQPLSWSLLASLGLCSLGAAVNAQASSPIHPTAARTWRTDTPRDTYVWTAPGASIDQSRALPVTGVLRGMVAELSDRPCPNAPVFESGEVSRQRIELDWTTLDLDPSQPHRVGLPLPEGGMCEVALLACDWSSPERFTWLGQIAGVANSSVILVRVGDVIRLVARNDNAHGRTFSIEYGGDDSHDLIEVVPIGNGCEGVFSRPELSSPKLEETPEAAPLQQGSSYSDASTRVDVMFVVTPLAQALEYFGNFTAFHADCFAMVADMNNRLSLSGSNLTVRNVDSDFGQLVGYTEKSPLVHNLYELSFPVGTTFAGYTTTDTSTDLLDTVRERSKPDVVAMITTSGTGVAWKPYKTALMDISDGYSVSSQDLAVANGTFAHEIGHNLGACHNANASAPTCEQTINGTDRGIEKVCELSFLSADKEYRTTMAYAVNSGTDQIRVERFSVEGLTASASDGLESCTVNLWASYAQVIETFQVSRPFVSNYAIGDTQVWARPGTGGGPGSWQDKVGSIKTASTLVSGPVGLATVRMVAGTYDEGGTVTISDTCTLVAEDGGTVTIQ